MGSNCLKRHSSKNFASSPRSSTITLAHLKKKTPTQQPHTMTDYGRSGSFHATNQQTLRDQQIAELRTHMPVAREVAQPTQPGTTAFSLGLQLNDKTIISMRIALGKDFPHAPPVIQLLSKCRHPWLSKEGYFKVVGHAGLRNWNLSSKKNSFAY